MKPKDLKPPFSWEQRRPLLEEGILYIPEYFFFHENYHFPLWEGVFKQKREKICVEICAGNGKWIVDRAQNDPLTNWVAVEIRFERARKILSKVKNEHLENLFVVCGDAKTLALSYTPAASIDEIFINFPDPWPKQRHAKNRLIEQGFVKELARILKPQGKLTFVTDDASYFEETYLHFERSLLFSNVEKVEEIEKYGTSYFDELWREMGRKIHFLQVTV